VIKQNHYKTNKRTRDDSTRCSRRAVWRLSDDRLASAGWLWWIVKIDH